MFAGFFIGKLKQ
ncbi:hypothetical protein D030_4539A, partial [Vibrio parahaemolyticus AQ3810]